MLQLLLIMAEVAEWLGLVVEFRFGFRAALHVDQKCHLAFAAQVDDL